MVYSPLERPVILHSTSIGQTQLAVSPMGFSMILIWRSLTEAVTTTFSVAQFNMTLICFRYNTPDFPASYSTLSISKGFVESPRVSPMAFTFLHPENCDQKSSLPHEVMETVNNVTRTIDNNRLCSMMLFPLISSHEEDCSTGSLLDKVDERPVSMEQRYRRTFVTVAIASTHHVYRNR